MSLVLSSLCKTIVELIELSFLFIYAHGLYNSLLSIFSIFSMSSIYFIYLLHPRLVNPCYGNGPISFIGCSSSNLLICRVRVLGELVILFTGISMVLRLDKCCWMRVCPTESEVDGRW
jgi:hypothetical protein